MFRSLTGGGIVIVHPSFRHSYFTTDSSAILIKVLLFLKQDL